MVTNLHSRRRFRHFIFIVVLILGATSPTFAQSTDTDEPSFGLHPALANIYDPAASGYFTFYAAPGDTIQDNVVLVNEGQVPVEVILYLTKATTAIGGSASFGAQGDTNEITDWVHLSKSTASLQPGEEQAVPFSVLVPDHTPPGDYLIGMVTELASPASDEARDSDTDDSATFSLAVVRRIGVAVLVVVEGERTPGLEITGIEFVDQNEQGARFFITVQNTGNTMLQGEGTVTLGDDNSNALGEFTFNMDTILPGDPAGFYTTGPLSLSDGEYSLSTQMDFFSLRGAIPQDPGMTPGGSAEAVTVSLSVENGNPLVTPSTSVPANDPELTIITSTQETDDTNKLFMGLGALLVIAVTALVLRRRTLKKTQ